MNKNKYWHNVNERLPYNVEYNPCYIVFDDGRISLSDAETVNKDYNGSNSRITHWMFLHDAVNYLTFEV